MQDQVEEVVERPVAGVDYDLVADRLRILRGVDDDCSGAPALTTISRLNKIRISGEGHGVRIVVWLIGRPDQRVPNGICRPNFDRVSSH